MSEFIQWYLLSGVTIYLILFVKNFHLFKDADLLSVTRGLLGIIVWPYIIWIIGE